MKTNTTRALPGPASSDANAQYAASITALVQMTSNGKISFIPSNSSGSAAAWSPVQPLASFTPPQGKDATPPSDPSPNDASVKQASGALRERMSVGAMTVVLLVAALGLSLV